MSNRKMTSVVGGVAALALLLAACGDDDNGDDTTPEGSDSQDEDPDDTEDDPAEDEMALSGDLTVWIMQPGESVLETLEETAAAFEAEHEGVTINYESIPWDGGHDQFVTAIAGGQVPDLAELGNTWLLEFAEQGAIEPVEWPETEEFVAGLGDSAVLDGTAYGYPWYAGVRALIYRTDIFDQAGVEVPTTWDELLEVGDTIAAETDIAPIRAAGSYQHFYQALIWGFGGDIATQDGDTWTPGWDTPEGHAALGFFNTLWEKGWSPEGAVQWNSLNVREDFANGEAAMMIGGGWDLTAILGANPDLEGNLGTALLPAGPTGNNDSFAGGSHLGVFAESDQKELAEAFAEFMVSAEQVSAFTGSEGFLPGTVAGVDAAVGDDELYGTFADQYLESSRFYPIGGWWGQAEGAAVIPNEVQKLMLGEQTVEETAAAIDAGLADQIG